MDQDHSLKTWLVAVHEEAVVLGYQAGGKDPKSTHG